MIVARRHGHRDRGVRRRRARRPARADRDRHAVARSTSTDGAVDRRRRSPTAARSARGVVVGGCDPFRLMALVGPTRSRRRCASGSSGVRRPGTTLKVNLALRDLPTLHLPARRRAEPVRRHHPPAAPTGPAARRGPRACGPTCRPGGCPTFPTIEWYVHTTVDPSLRTPRATTTRRCSCSGCRTSRRLDLGRRADRLRRAPAGASATASRRARRTWWPTRSRCRRPGIETHFGITGGHIHHVDNTFAFADRMPYATGLDGLYACSAGCHPAGSVIGAAGHNAAQRILADLRRTPEDAR